MNSGVFIPSAGLFPLFSYATRHTLFLVDPESPEGLDCDLCCSYISQIPDVQTVALLIDLLRSSKNVLVKHPWP